MKRRFLNSIQTNVNTDEYLKLYFTIEALSTGTVYLKVPATYQSVHYRLNNNDWIQYTSACKVSVKKGDKVQLKANATSWKNMNFSVSCSYIVYGNIMSLLYNDDFENQFVLPSNEVFRRLFYSNTNLKSVENLRLPATTLTQQCYLDMFRSCRYLIAAPQLPATTLAKSCYYGMFYECSALTTAPQLPATQLNRLCYLEMFSSCKSLTIAPELPSTTLAEDCYWGMFSYCKKLTEAPQLPATRLARFCYREMFMGCTMLTQAPKLPATKLETECYYSMFENCTSLTISPELPATTLADLCYSRMFFGSNAVPDCSNINFSDQYTVRIGALRGLFWGTKVTDSYLETILPKNSDGNIYLPVTTLASRCYEYMFTSCKQITTAPELPATELAYGCYNHMFSYCYALKKAPELPATELTNDCYSLMFYNCSALEIAPELPAIILTDGCYSHMFDGCASLITAPQLPATTLAKSCYTSMFYGCSLLTTAPELPAETLADYCYQNMFYGCSSLNNIVMLATDISASRCLIDWVYGVSSTGTFVKHQDMTSLSSDSNGIPSGWEVKNYVTPTECTSLTITANDVVGNDTTTTIHYTAIYNGIDYKGETVTGIVKEGTAISAEFPQNTSETDTVERTITFEFIGVTASTIITQGVWINQSYILDLNNQWELSATISNPDSSLYDGVYQSFSNKGTNSKAAIMYIDIYGYTNFDLYIRSYAESTFDYVMVSQLDQTIDNNTSYSNSTLVKAHTVGNQKSGNTISDYTKVSFTGITSGLHRITIVYRKDSSGNTGDDRGYVLLLKNKNTSDEVNLITFTIERTGYQAEEGMTWEEWVTSKYNTGGFYIGSCDGADNVVVLPDGSNYIGEASLSSYIAVKYKDTVESKNYTYFLGGDGDFG